MENKEEQINPVQENPGSIESRLKSLEDKVGNLRTIVLILAIAFGIAIYLFHPIYEAWDKLDALISVGRAMSGN